MQVYEQLERIERKNWAHQRDSRGKGSREERKTESGVWDRATLDAVYRLMKRGLVETVDCPISTGKEGDVYLAFTPEAKPIALKVYRTGTADFRAIERYIAGDTRFPDRRTTTRDTIYTWARKEWLNLRLATEAGVPVPAPLAQHRNVLAMEYIGTDDTPAPELRNVKLEDPAAFLELLLAAAARLYQGAGLVHGDLSEYNVLVHDGAPVIIDLGQAMLLKHPMAEELMERDCANLARYFRRLGVDTDEARIMARITRPSRRARAPKAAARRAAKARSAKVRAARAVRRSRRDAAEREWRARTARAPGASRRSKARKAGARKEGAK